MFASAGAYVFSMSDPPPPSAGGEGAADFSQRGHHSAESHDRRSVSECGGRRECNLFSVQQFTGYIIILVIDLINSFFSP